ncbi:MAG: hypothetical protein EXS01_05280 [Phycisphaerales bacterium]|nr:hypothetical protein [Phycisphaerales bacterium]
MWKAAVILRKSVIAMQFHGVDFSGADNGGMHKIRVASWKSPTEISVERADRSALMRMILASAKSSEHHVWRVDAASGLPVSTLRAHSIDQSWLAAARWSAAIGSPRGWRTQLRLISREEPRRVADAEARTPMAPMNLRVFKATWTFICEVLLPLHEAGVSIAPMAPTASHATVCEGNSSSVLNRLGFPTRGYKGEGDPPKRVRALIARRLEESGIPISTNLMQQAIADSEGDVLDALILLTPLVHTVVPAEAAVEGWIF